MYAEIHVERGRIRAVLPCTTGSIIRTETDSFEYPGSHVLPGFVDNHAHIVGLGARLTSVSLHDATSLEECLARIAAAPVHDGRWIRAMGWNQEHWTQQEYPLNTALDAIHADVPVVATRVDGHAMWLNSAAQRASGLDVRDEVLVDAEMDPVWNAMPSASDEELRVNIVAACNACLAVGITEVHDMDVHPLWLEPMRALAEAGALPIRLQSFVRAQHNEWHETGTLPMGGEFLRICGVKMYADGALGSHGAFLLSPYADRPSTDGICMLTTSEMISRARLALDAGWWSIATHAIGDAAVRNVLDAYEEVRSWSDGRDVLLRIEHAQHVHPDDVKRFAELNVMACVQPTHCLSDADMAERRLGDERLPWAYRWRSLLDAGVTLGAGSDFPIEPPSPLDGIDAFVRRVPRGHVSSWQDGECITRDEAIEAFTRAAHVTAEMDFRRGQLVAGMDADLVILDRDIYTCPDDEIRSATIMATFVAGRRRYTA
ncbi:MAG: amidohydrolase family protein [bacterium]|nr:amidohydrolase family protein [bacterium]